MHKGADTPRERLRRFVGLCHDRASDARCARRRFPLIVATAAAMVSNSERAKERRCCPAQKRASFAIRHRYSHAPFGTQGQFAAAHADRPEFGGLLLRRVAGSLHSSNFDLKRSFRNPNRKRRLWLFLGRAADISLHLDRMACDLGAERVQPLVDLLIPTLDLLSVVYGAGALGTHRCKQHGHTRTNIRAL